MEETILNAYYRETKGKFSEEGYVAGVIYGNNTESTPVKFEDKELKQVLVKHGPNAKVWVKLEDKPKSFGFIKDIQKHTLKGGITHVDIQLVAMDQEVTINVPIIYTGEESLKGQSLFLQIFKPDINATGTMSQLPNILELDVSNKSEGDNITISDFNIQEGITINDAEDQVYAAVNKLEEFSAEEDKNATKETDQVDEE